MRRLPRLIMPTSSVLCVGRIRRSRRIRQWCNTGLNTVHNLSPRPFGERVRVRGTNGAALNIRHELFPDF
ncbi:hypothetical protein DZI82_00940 [Escherichia coli]|nr:hypothetical protein [Escherichia coli]